MTKIVALYRPEFRRYQEFPQSPGYLPQNFWNKARATFTPRYLLKLIMWSYDFIISNHNYTLRLFLINYLGLAFCKIDDSHQCLNVMKSVKPHVILMSVLRLVEQDNIINFNVNKEISEGTLNLGSIKVRYVPSLTILATGV